MVPLDVLVMQLSPNLLVRQVITGISIGSWLFLVAVGLSLIFGVLDVLNFTHGVLFMIGAYMAVVTTVGGGGVPGLSLILVPLVDVWPLHPFWLGIVVAGVTVGLLGGIVESGFIRRVYDREPLDQLLLTFAFVLMLTDLTRVVFGTGQYAIRPPEVFRFTIQVTEGVRVGGYRLFVIGMAVLIMLVLFTVLDRTNIGRVTRATSSDRDMASLLGINVPRLYTGVFIAGAVLAGIGGALAAPLQSVTTSLGNQVIIYAFVVAVIGGLGSFVGAFVGAMIIGLLLALGSQIIQGGGTLFPYVAMIIVLVFRPEGLFGEVEA
ncbi:branched-chain amino acid ABC transporter permease [Halomarina rubra]|uniref:Branched-chain amino acid ABC transporter permease n=1 Tax=Halomarina rubra TaxID=2071873 RepID=A0ABD6AQY4_9EURY|nr:branched-chain amino acid ABC transporter permease [Halomarina rubra]